MEKQKITNVSGTADNESLKRATRKWYIINNQNNTDYGDEDEKAATIKFETKVIKSNLCDYSDAYILVTGDITVRNGDANTKVAFKNCTPFTKWVTHRNDEHVDNADNLDILIPMYNLIEYSDNYSDTSGRLWQFKRDEQNMNNVNPADVTTDGSSSFKYKSSFFRSLTAADNGAFKNLKISVLLKYLSNFWSSFEMLLINCIIRLKLNWNKVCVMSTIVGTTF